MSCLPSHLILFSLGVLFLPLSPSFSYGMEKEKDEKGRKSFSSSSRNPKKNSFRILDPYWTDTFPYPGNETPPQIQRTVPLDLEAPGTSEEETGTSEEEPESGKDSTDSQEEFSGFEDSSTDSQDTDVIDLREEPAFTDEEIRKRKQLPRYYKKIKSDDSLERSQKIKQSKYSHVKLAPRRTQSSWGEALSQVREKFLSNADKNKSPSLPPKVLPFQECVHSPSHLTGYEDLVTEKGKQWLKEEWEQLERQQADLKKSQAHLEEEQACFQETQKQLAESQKSFEDKERHLKEVQEVLEKIKKREEEKSIYLSQEQKRLEEDHKQVEKVWKKIKKAQTFLHEIGRQTLEKQHQIEEDRKNLGQERLQWAEIRKQDDAQKRRDHLSLQEKMRWVVSGALGTTFAAFFDSVWGSHIQGYITGASQNTNLPPDKETSLSEASFQKPTFSLSEGRQKRGRIGRVVVEIAAGSLFGVLSYFILPSLPIIGNYFKDIQV